MRHLPNLITLIRLLLIVPIAAALAREQLLLAIALFAAAAVSDAIDGFLARRFGWQSDLGSMLDPIADKLLLMTVFVTLAALRLAPWWLVAAALIRDAVIVAGAGAYRWLIGPLTAQPTLASKFNTMCQAAFILVVIARAAFGVPALWAATAMGGVVFATIVVSGIDYMLTYGRRAVLQSAHARGALSTSGP